MARDIWTFMNTIQVVCGIHCYHCTYEADTVHYIGALHHWWNKEYDEHKGHLQAHTGTVVQLSKQPYLRQAAALLDGIGWEKAKMISERYDFMVELMDATPKELMEIPGVGKKLAGSIIKQLRGK